MGITAVDHVTATIINWDGRIDCLCGSSRVWAKMDDNVRLWAMQMPPDDDNGVKEK